MRAFQNYTTTREGNILPLPPQPLDISIDSISFQVLRKSCGNVSTLQLQYNGLIVR